MEWPHEAAVEVERWLVRWKPHFEISVNFRLCGSIAPLKREETTTNRVTSRGKSEGKGPEWLGRGEFVAGNDDFSGVAAVSNRRESSKRQLQDESQVPPKIT
jgi:hypothetical protein